MQSDPATHVLSMYQDIIREEFPHEDLFGISFLADSEDYAETVEPLNHNIGVSFFSKASLPTMKVISHFDYDESLLDNQIFSEVNRCMLQGMKFLKIITPLFVGDSHDIILAPESYLNKVLYAVKQIKDFKINTSIHAPLVDLPLDELKRDVLDFLDNKEFSEFCKKYSIKQKRGLIFAGPPGNGKTLSLSWLKSQALQRNIDFTAYKSAKDYMDNEGDIRGGGQQSKKIIVFEEFDTYLQERDVGTIGNDRMESNQVLGSLLQTLDGIEEVSNVVFIFTTNFPQSFDSAIMRPGRIDKVVNFPLPSEESQRKFLGKYLEEYSEVVRSFVVDHLKNKVGMLPMPS